MTSRRIVSLVPSATEIVAELAGSPGRLVGVTHECDWPPWVRDLPKVVAPANPAILDMNPADVDKIVSAQVGGAESLYRIDVRLLESLEPDLVVTQTLCDVCAASPEELARALAGLSSKPQVLELGPMTLADVLADVERVGEAMGENAAAAAWKARLERRVDGLRRQAPPAPRPSVLALEWADPPWTAGHWVPEMIELAGGEALLGGSGEKSRRTSWAEIAASAPDVVLVQCCGYDVEKNEAEARRLLSNPSFRALPAAQSARIYALDANSYFSRPAPRLVDGAELLADLLRSRPVDPARCVRVKP